MICRMVAPSGVMVPNWTSWSSVSLSFLNLRMVSAGPSIASGGAMTLTREPSGRRASQIGLASSTRRPTWLTMRWQMLRSWQLSRKRTSVSCDLALHLDEDAVGAVDHDVGDVVAREQRLERAVAEHVVADVLEQLLLLGDRHHHVLHRDDVVDDVADFLARLVHVHLGQLRQVDRVDQRAEDLRLQVVIFVGLARPLGAAARPAAPAARPRRRRGGRRQPAVGARNRLQRPVRQQVVGGAALSEHVRSLPCVSSPSWPCGFAFGRDFSLSQQRRRARGRACAPSSAPCGR